MTTGPARTPLRLQRPLVFALVALAAVTAVLVSVAVARAEASQRADDLADRAVDASATVVASLVAGLGGAAGLVGGDGSLRVDGFDAYAQDVVAQSPAEALALVTIVPDQERDAIERALGRPIVDEVGGPPAARRPVYYVFRRITPGTAANRPLMGVDIGVDPVRSAAAERALATGLTVITAPLASLPSGAPAFFVAKPLYRPGEDGMPRTDRPAALVTTAFRGDRLLDGVTSRLPPGSRLEVRDGDAVLAATNPAPGEGARRREVSVLDRRWDVRIDDLEPVAYWTAWLVGLVGAAVVGALGLVLLRGARYEQRLRGGTEAMGRLADLSRDLAVATEVDELACAVSTHVPPILGAQLAGVAVVEPERGRLRMIRQPDIPAALVHAFGEIDLMARSPIAAAVLSGEPVLLGDAAAIRKDLLPEEAGALEDAGFGAVAVLPLTVRGEVAAIVGVAWRAAQRVGPGQEARLRTVREVSTETLERIESAQTSVRRENGLATLARRLSSTSSAREVSTIVFGEAGNVAEAVHANLAFVKAGSDELVIEARSTLAGELAPRYHRVPLDAGVPLTDAVVRNEPVWITDPADMAARYPSIVDGAQRVGFEALVALPLRDSAGAAIGALGLAWSAPVRPDAALRSTLDIVADMTAQTFERVELVDQRLRQAELNRRLAHLAELLATAGTTDEVVATLVSSSATSVSAADAAVGVVDPHRGIIHLLDGAADEGRTVSLADGNEDPAAEAVRTQSSVVTGDGAHEPSVIAVALVDHRRQPIGAIAVTFQPGRVVGREDVRAVRRLADLAGQALERAVITDGERRRTALLAAFATELSAARALDEVMDVVVRAGGRPVDADDVRVGLVDEGRELVAVHHLPPDGGPIQVTELSLEPGLDPVRDAVARREVVMVADGEEWIRRYPGSAVADDGLQAWAALPLRRADGGRLGVLAIAWRRAVTFDDQTGAALHVIARLAAQAIQRAALHDIEHRVVADLQERLITDLPETPGLALAARYRAAGPGLEMGGDWFAGFPLDAGRLGLIVGDMAGHGISAVADMAQVRAMTSALLRAGLGPEQVAEQASRFVAESASGVASAMISVVDPVAGSLTCVVAGQVPPMLVLPDGTVDVLDDLRRPLLGVANPTTRPVVVHRPFPPGCLFVAYTDGLIERRGELLDEGIARLRQALHERAREHPDALADQLLTELLGSDARDAEDDVALVIVQAEARPSPLGDGASFGGNRLGLVTAPNR